MERFLTAKERFLVSRFTVERSLRVDSSIKVNLRLFERFDEVVRSEVSKIYTIYNRAGNTLDVYVSKSTEAPESDAALCSLVSNKEDAQDESTALVAAVSAQAIRITLFEKPSYLGIQGYFLPQVDVVDGQDFPDIIALTTAHSEFKIDSRRSTKLRKGFLFTFCKVMEEEQLDLRLMSFKNTYRIPRFFYERLDRQVNLDQYGKVPVELRFLFHVLDKVTRADPQNKVEVQQYWGKEIRQKLIPPRILNMLASCGPWAESLQLETFIQETCTALCSMMEGKQIAEDPFDYIRCLFGFRTPTT